MTARKTDTVKYKIALLLRILRDKTMDGKLMYFLIDDSQNHLFCSRLQLVAQNVWKSTNKISIKVSKVDETKN